MIGVKHVHMAFQSADHCTVTFICEQNDFEFQAVRSFHKMDLKQITEFCHAQKEAIEKLDVSIDFKGIGEKWAQETLRSM